MPISWVTFKVQTTIQKVWVAAFHQVPGYMYELEQKNYK
jgi:hypothetical protein